MRSLTENVYSVGVIDWDIKLFDKLIPLPDGTSYNSYFVKGTEKTALIDTVEPSKIDELLAHLVQAGVDNIDYIVSHHAEQDHSGSLPDLLIMYPDAKIVTNPKCKDMLVDLLEIEDEKFITVENHEVLSLGEKSLEFIYTPWVHWPETMCSYLKEDRILFSCDFFGSHLATSDLFVSSERDIYEPAKRYFAEIMMPYSKPIRSHIKMLSEMDIDMIAPSHGPVYDNPGFIMDAYAEWAGEEPENLVIIPYVSMHGSTEKLVSYLADSLIARGISVKLFELSQLDLGKLAISLVDAATIVIGSSTVLVGPHPHAASAAFVANMLRPKAKFASIIGSYGWGTKAVDQLTALMPNLKVQLIDPVIIKGTLKEGEYEQVEDLADKILEAHKKEGLL